MELINTIELSPFDFANSDYDLPSINSENASEERYEFWKKCLSDKNLDKIEPVTKGSYLVNLASVNSSDLREILKSELEDIDLLDFEEQTSVMSGGIVIKMRNEIIIEPMCCGDIGNIHGWDNALIESSTDWKQLWIGHPWIFCRKKADSIEFSEYYEKNIEEISSVKSVLKVSVTELKNKLEVLKREQIAFEDKIQKALKEMGIMNSREIAKMMTGNI